jgi:hypothetical protein
MKSRTCPQCGKKNFTESPVCSHCGGPLEMLPTKTPSTASPGKKAPPPPLTTPQDSSPSPISRGTCTGGRPSPSSAPAPASSPSTAPAPYSPTPSSSASAWATAPIPYTPSSPLPLHLARLAAPDLEGAVVDTREIQVKSTDVSGDLLRFIVALLLLPLRPLMILAAWIFGGRKSPETQTIYMVRVQRSDGTIAQARVEQDIEGVTMDLGDYVSIWGANRSGALVVKHAYNHTVGGEVKLHYKMGAIINQIILVALFIFLIFVCLLLFGACSRA